MHKALMYGDGDKDMDALFDEASAPLITIGVTCFNAADTIGRAILSAKRQDWPNKEIIVVDDTSTDNSPAVLEELARNNPEIRIIRHETNKGYPGALNTMVKAARGEFVAIFDDDDESRADRLRLQWQRIVAHEQAHATDLIFCYTNRGVVAAGEEQPGQTTLAIGRRAPEPHGAAVADFLLCLVQAGSFVWGEFGSCTLMSRRSTLIGLGCFDETFRRCAEWDLAIRMGFLGGHFIAIDQPLVTQYLTPGAEKSGKAPLRYALDLRRKYKPYLSNQGVYWSSLAQAHARFHFAKGKRWKQRLFTAAACLFAPRRLMPHILALRMRRPQGAGLGRL